MTLISGLDSAFPPTLAQALAAKAAGHNWWGFYLPKLPNTDPLNGWTITQVNILKQAGIAPVPICVPSPPAPADAIQTATEYFNLAKQYGLSPKIAICYNGSHIPVTGPVWLPVPQPNPPTAVGPGSALQWSTGAFAGLSVDFNLAAPDFPMSNGLVCDLEFNVTYTSTWYQAFQNEVVKLANVPPAPPSPAPASAHHLPPTVKVVDANATWGPGPRYDLIITGSDGNCYHRWWMPDRGWSAFETLN